MKSNMKQKDEKQKKKMKKTTLNENILKNTDMDVFFFCMKTTTPIDAEKCKFYADKRPDTSHSWKPSKTTTKSQKNKE